MIKRELSKKLLQLSKKFPVVTVTGPRQSGKTTLVKAVFKDYDYATLEDPDIRLLAQDNPREFLNNHKKGLIIDEVQRVPELFSYLQGIVDNSGKTGEFILTGSQNFLLLEKISQSLAGRVAILKLLPLSLSELQKEGLPTDNATQLIFKGLYPRLYDKAIEPEDYYPYYLQTYVERDVRLIKNITNQSAFIRFMKLCAGRTGQLLNVNELSVTAGISRKTVNDWLAILQASYILYLLQPYHKNYNKRLIKMPKIYFNDTGLACSLLGIKSMEQLFTHFAFGSLFENLVINEFVKYAYNRGVSPDYSFWRDSAGHEIDLIVEKDFQTVKAYEIKAGKTFSQDFFKNLLYWQKITGNPPENCAVIYGGKTGFLSKKGEIIGWDNLKELLSSIG